MSIKIDVFGMLDPKGTYIEGSMRDCPVRAVQAFSERSGLSGRKINTLDYKVAKFVAMRSDAEAAEPSAKLVETTLVEPIVAQPATQEDSADPSTELGADPASQGEQNGDEEAK